LNGVIAALHDADIPELHNLSIHRLLYLAEGNGRALLLREIHPRSLSFFA
jgi:hypothetical protein